MTGRVTVPVLWDKQKRTIVNNESAEIIRMLNSEFDAFGDSSLDFYPEELRAKIDEINAYVYDRINNGVYKAGFATDQTVYEQAFERLFEALDTVEERLGRQRYLVGNRLTEADWRLFTTLVRFDPVYVGHFKCNLRRIADYPNLSNYLRELYQVDGVSETVNLYYSTYGHIESMANAVAEGARSVSGTDVTVKRVPELMPPEIARQAGVKLDQAAPVATPAELAEYDAIIFGTPTRFGNMASQMRNFLDQTGGLWAKGSLIGKVGSVFASTATQHGGQESTILSWITSSGTTTAATPPSTRPASCPRGLRSIMTHPMTVTGSVHRNDHDDQRHSVQVPGPLR